MTAIDLRLGKCLDVLRTLPDASVDACVTDNPYALGREPTLEELVAYLQGADLNLGDFMGEDWELPSVPTWREVFRVLKPGAHLLAFSAPRTHDLVAIGIRAAGFEIRDSIDWLFARGWAKGLNVSKAIDAHLGAERTEVVGVRPGHENFAGRETHPLNGGWDRPWAHDPDAVARYHQQTAPGTAEAAKYEGWSTGLKPAHEPIVLARKPLQGTVAENVLAHGVGGINVDACRIPGAYSVHGGSSCKLWSHYRKEEKLRSEREGEESAERVYAADPSDFHAKPSPAAHQAGRWPANVLFTHAAECEMVGHKRVHAGNSNQGVVHGTGDGTTYAACKESGTHHADADGMETVEEWRCVERCPVGELNRQSGVLKSGGQVVRKRSGLGYKGVAFGRVNQPVGTQQIFYGDEGYAARFFYCTKASVDEREAGLDHLPAQQGGRRNHHPTVKPLALMTWLVQLVCPPGGLVLDPYMGSGTTGLAASRLGMRFLGIEKDERFMRIARVRLEEDAPLFNRGRTGGGP